jgi:dihydrofolate reductase
LESGTFTLHAVVAMAANRLIGRAGSLPWRLPEDLKFFKSLTLGHPVIMGRKTHESIGRPLPHRRNIVLSRSTCQTSQTSHTSHTSPGPAPVEIIQSPGELAHLGLTGRGFVIGGAEIYQLLLPQCASVIVSRVAGDWEGDAYMPSFEADFPVAERLAAFPTFEVWEHHRTEPAAAAAKISKDSHPIG